MIEMIDKFCDEAKRSMKDEGYSEDRLKEIDDVCIHLKAMTKAIDEQVDKNSKGFSKQLIKKMCYSIAFHRLSNGSLKMAKELGCENKPGASKLIGFLDSTYKNLDKEIRRYAKALGKEAFNKHIEKCSDIMIKADGDSDDKPKENRTGIDKHELKSLSDNFPHFGLDMDTKNKRCKLEPSPATLFYMIVESYDYNEECYDEIKETLNRLFDKWDTALSKRLKLILNRHGLEKAWEEYEEFLYMKGEYFTDELQMARG